MEENKFLQLSENTLIKLADYIENNDEKSIFDVEYSDGILNIEIFDKKQTYVINKHSASKKIWFSSPISGADYFSYCEIQENWLDKNQKDLETILINELIQNYNFKIK
jgi:iron donor protein CyaY